MGERTATAFDRPPRDPDLYIVELEDGEADPSFHTLEEAQWWRARELRALWAENPDGVPPGLPVRPVWVGDPIPQATPDGKEVGGG